MTQQPIPNFFIVGAPKCGTTALFHYLSAHPDVFAPARKEFNYFCDDLHFNNVAGLFNYRDAADYLSHFTAWNGQKRIGEASVWYLYSMRAAANIHRFSPDAKIIVMIRNPAEMLYSLHSQLLETGDEDLVTFEAALNAEPDRKRRLRIPQTDQASAPIEGLWYTEVARFADQIERFQKVFGADAVKVVVYDDFKVDTAATYRGVLDFLDIHPEHRPDFRVVNPNRAIKNERLWRFMKFGPPALRQAWRRTIPAPMRGRILRWMNQRNLVEQKRPDMHEETRERLRKTFTPEVERLSKMLGRDLMGWVETSDGKLMR